MSGKMRLSDSLLSKIDHLCDDERHPFTIKTNFGLEKLRARSASGSGAQNLRGRTYFALQKRKKPFDYKFPVE